MACAHQDMVPSAAVTDDVPPRVYSHCPRCKQDFHPDSAQVSGPNSTPPEPLSDIQ